MIFVARQLQERCREQHQDLCMAFVDLTKAFDKSIETFFGTFCANLAAIPLLSPYVLCGQVVMAGSQSSSFPVEVGVKQGCVQAPIIFNLLLVAMTCISP